MATLKMIEKLANKMGCIVTVSGNHIYIDPPKGRHFAVNVPSAFEEELMGVDDFNSLFVEIYSDFGYYPTNAQKKEAYNYIYSDLKQGLVPFKKDIVK